ncbi:MAG: hypothetical protein HXX20_00295 [Chloroflexi bacterium]|nr:hypothetical protein [Chloroflexota bacterium]
MENPFLNKSLLNSPLQFDLCAQIHFSALYGVRHKLQVDEIPDNIPISQLCQEAKLKGREIYLAHPTDIYQIFEGVTLAVYNTIEELYCSRLNRSIKMVWLILEKMAIEAGSPELSYEAVWAICQYLGRLRKVYSDTTLEVYQSEWLVVKITPSVYIQQSESICFKPSVVCIIDTLSIKVIAFRVGKEEETEENIALSIYDAIEACRQPGREGAGGLVWQIPEQLLSNISVSDRIQRACAGIGISIQSVANRMPILNALQGVWTGDLTGKRLSYNKFMSLLDTYLENVHGHGPLINREKRSQELKQFVGYNRDPAWQFPALRYLLPQHAGIISQNGTVEFDGLHYTSDLIKYWHNHEVTLRRSEMEEAVAWIYLDGEILCQAVASELIRADGSYRPNRLGRGG